LSRHPLTAIRLKLKRGREHFDALDQEIGAFVSPDRFPIRASPADESGWKRVHVAIVEEPPNEWGGLAGEVAGQWRSALDLLIFQLALIGNGHPGRTRTQFPIFTDFDQYTRKDKRGRAKQGTMLKNVGATHRAIIDSYQPYHRVNPDRDPLALLKAIRDADEHRDLAVAVMLSKRPNVGIESVEDFSIGNAQFRWPPLRAPLHGEAEILGVKLWPNPYAKVKMQIEARFEVGFEPTGATMDDLDRIGRHVQRIFGRFEGDFP
jgi:hypothetical protein